MPSDEPTGTVPPTEPGDDEPPVEGDPTPEVGTEGADEPTIEVGASSEEPDEEAEAARRALWPWVARRTQPQVIALVLISCLALGPIVALVSILRADPTPVHALVTPPEDPEVTRVRATAMGLTPSTGELRARLSVAPSSELIDESGRLTEPLSVQAFGTQGLTTRDYLVGEAPTPFEVSLPLLQGSTSRYPFDSYQSTLLVSVKLGSAEDKQTPHPIEVEARSVVEDFTLSAAMAEDAAPGAQVSPKLDWTAERPATTTIYAVWLMVLMWGLAVTGLLLVWAVVIWMVDLPFWVFGYFVGVLFALPPLRDSLPGRPPPGTIFDFGSFYWAVTIIGVSLILMLAIWLRRTRDEQRLRRLDSGRPT